MALLKPGGLKNPRINIINGFEHGSLRVLTMYWRACIFSCNLEAALNIPDSIGARKCAGNIPKTMKMHSFAWATRAKPFARLPFSAGGIDAGPEILPAACILGVIANLKVPAGPPEPA